MNKKIFHIFICTIYYFLQDFCKKSIPPIAEIIAAISASYSSHISVAYIFNHLQNNISAYYKIIQRKNFDYFNIYRRILLFVLQFLSKSNSYFYLCLDDTFSPRFSKKAPNCQIIYKKGKYLLSQVRIIISAIISINDNKTISLPVLVKLVAKVENSNKLDDALEMIKLIHNWINEKFSKKIILLTDAWYMRGKLLIDVVGEYGITVIGRVRKDTVLHFPVAEFGLKKRGRPRIYGEKISKNYIKNLPVKKVKLFLYSKLREVEYKSVIGYPRFLKGKIKCRCVYVRIKDLKQKDFALIICTNPNLKEEEIIKSYAKRWKIETMFRELKQIFGFNEIWQQKEETVNKMTSIVMASYSITSILSYFATIKKMKVKDIICYRKDNNFTVGLMKVFLIKILGRFNVRKEMKKIYKQKIDFEGEIWGYFTRLPHGLYTIICNILMINVFLNYT